MSICSLTGIMRKNYPNGKKVATGKLDEDSVAPRKFMNSNLLSYNIKRFCEKKGANSFIPRFSPHL